MIEKIKITKSSGNVYKDMGYADQFADEMQAKTKFVAKINEVIEKKQLTQKQAAKILGISQPNVSLLSRGIVSSFSIERLIRFLSRLHMDVEIVIHEKDGKNSSKLGHISVVWA